MRDARQDPELSALAELEDSELRELLKRMDRVNLVHALADPAWSGLKARLLVNLPSGTRRDLEDAWAYASPDAEATREAQRSLLRTAADLHELGVIALPEPGEVWVPGTEAAAHPDSALEARVAALGEEAIRKVLAGVDKKALTWCLFAASPRMKDAFYAMMTSRAVAMMEEEIAFHGRLRLREIEAARAELRDLLEDEP